MLLLLLSVIRVLVPVLLLPVLLILFVPLLLLPSEVELFMKSVSVFFLSGDDVTFDKRALLRVRNASSRLFLNGES